MVNNNLISQLILFIFTGKYVHYFYHEINTLNLVCFNLVYQLINQLTILLIVVYCFCFFFVQLSEQLKDQDFYKYKIYIIILYRIAIFKIN